MLLHDVRRIHHLMALQDESSLAAHVGERAVRGGEDELSVADSSVHQQRQQDDSKGMSGCMRQVAL